MESTVLQCVGMKNTKYKSRKFEIDFRLQKMMMSAEEFNNKGELRMVRQAASSATEH
ncbi:hypothetical protein [Pseudoduganella sp. RAF53_2]|uniref:hypothetical protein n=1 Tax=unclassified Pseudoduganella TaxID=2637179 RepID=UPI003F9A3EAB